MDRILRAIGSLKTAFEGNIDDIKISYAGKAFLNRAMCRIVKKSGIGLDVVSGGELYTALCSGVDPKDITYHGNYKSPAEMREAIESGVGVITVDGREEISALDNIADAIGKKVDIHLRVNPGVEAHTHEFISTGKTDSKFGIPLGEVGKAAKMAKEAKNINLIGLHCHIGSQISLPDPYSLALEIMLKTACDLREEGINITEINMGGGFGIRYTEADDPFDLEGFAKNMGENLRRLCSKLNFPIPKIIIEPGRYIVGPAGITLYTVGAVKNIEGVRKYVTVDGGMNDNPRPALYDARYSALAANKADIPAEEYEKVTVSGRSCEADTLIKDIYLAKVVPGDIIAVLDTGAYCYSMASNYNRLAVPKMVMTYGDKAEVIEREQTYEDLIGRDIIPSWL